MVIDLLCLHGDLKGDLTNKFRGVKSKILGIEWDSGTTGTDGNFI